MATRSRRLSATAFVVCALVVGGCSGSAPAPTPTDDRAARSQTALVELVGRNTNPGCSAAIGERGEVRWQGRRGLAVLEPATPITAESTFDIGSVSKQFTALAAALLAEEGRLSLDDTVAEHLNGFPDWAGQVTLAELIHQTSGIPEVIGLMRQRGVWLDVDASRHDLLKAISEVESLNFKPGSRWAYSNSNYVLVGLIIERVSGRPLDAQLAQTFFTPLGLAMVVDAPGTNPDRTRSYVGNVNGQFEIADWPWETTGFAGVRAAPSDLVRWADVYRTGVVSGELATEPQTEAAAGAEADSSYGLGIFVASDGRLWHGGESGGFYTAFGVSADRDHAIAVTCNSIALDPWVLFDALVLIWEV